MNQCADITCKDGWIKQLKKHDYISSRYNAWNIVWTMVLISNCVWWDIGSFFRNVGLKILCGMRDVETCFTHCTN